MIKPEDLSCNIDFKTDLGIINEIADKYLTPEYHDIQRCFTKDDQWLTQGYTEYDDCRWCMVYFSDIPEDLSDIPLISDLYDVFHVVDSHNTPDLIYNSLFLFDIWGELPYHIDQPWRTCGFNIPLRGVQAPTSWRDPDTQEVIHTHDWQGPALINTEVPHGSPVNTGQRLFLSMGGFFQSLSKVTGVLRDSEKI